MYESPAASSREANSSMDFRASPHDRVRGCLLGGASGDALGAAVEFQRLPEILEHFGSSGIRDLAPSFGRLGAITADTQLSLFTAEGLIRAAVLQAGSGRADTAASIHRSYLRWLKTQGETPPLEVPMDGWLVHLHPLWSRRAPGLTCQSALRNLETLGAAARNDSVGNGAVTHIAPVGLVTPAPEAFDAGERIAALTHGHPSARLSAAVLASLVAHVLQGEGFKEALQAAMQALRAHPGHEEVAQGLAQAEALAASGRPADAAAVESLGAGWVATQALAIAVYSVLAASSFEAAVILAVNHSGDSDSTGALAGSLAGALYGVQAIPGRWTVDLELRTEILALADDLQGLRTGSLDLASPATRERYPGR
jgi:ADP-ribosyl-[dinitrogen reductase] hydrolase